MKKLLTVMAFSVGLFANAQTGNLFKPVKEVALRTPSVPIVVSDPHFSIWSPYDKLMEGSTEHWTTAKKPLVGALRVDGKVYRFLGKDQVALIPIAPMTNVERWEAAYTNSQPANGWQEFQFDDSSWKKGKAAFGSRDMPRVRTEWKGDNTDIYIRRTFEINDLDLTENIFLIYSHDDVFELYLNGEKLVATDLVWKNNVNLKLSDEAKKKLRNGKNVIAAHCHNTTGGSYVDFGLYREKKNAVTFENEAVQKSVDVLATSSYYTFTCGPVELDVVFTAPQLIDDLDLLSTPINYISYRVRPLDKKEHDVQFYIETTPVLAVNETTQPTIARTLSKNGISYVEAGTINQPICDRKGDLICADWGYVYLGSVNGAGKSISLGDYSGMKEAFVKNGTLASSKTKWVTRREENTPAMAYVHNLGTVTKDGKDGFLMIGYDDIYSMTPEQCGLSSEEISSRQEEIQYQYSGFMRAYEQVQYVVENNRAAGTDEQQLIYEGGYEQLFGEISMKGRLIGELLCVLVAVYSAAGLLGMEYDLKVMNLLQSTKKGRGTLLRVKLGVAAGVTTVMFVLVKIPVVMRIVQNYPLTGWTAKVRSMRFAGTSVFNCPVWAYVLLLLLLQLGTLYVVILCVTALSAVLKDTMLTLILSVLLFGGTLVMEWGGLGMIHSWSINTLLDGHRLLQSGGMQFALTVLVFWGVLPLAAGTVLHRVYKKRGQAIWN